MKLDFKDNLNQYGDNILRLFDFKMAEAILLRDVIIKFLEGDNPYLKFDDLEFIESVGCCLTFAIHEEDLGVVTRDKKDFFCAMTKEGFEGILKLLQPYCEKECKGYQYLYDIDSHTDLVLAPVGT